MRPRILPTVVGLAFAALVAACSVVPEAAGPEPTPPSIESRTLPAPAATTTATGRPTSEPPSTEEPAAGFDVEPVGWSRCGAGLECGAIAVPLDHANPTGETIEVSLVRVPATGRDVRGSIFVNPGGPGGSGVRFVTNGFRLDPDTMAAYHLVGFDPRGVGGSRPLRCRVDLTEPRPDLSPDTAEEADTLDRQAMAVAEECRRTDGDLLPHIGTDSVVADLDLARQAVGDERLHYYGLSYGTLIGLRYAARFPERVGHLVLDGVVDPSFALPDLLRQQAVAFERAFADLDSACGAGLRCPAGGLGAAYDRVSARLEQPGSAASVGSAELDLASLFVLYGENLRPSYAEAMIAADAGDLSGVERLHDQFVTGADYAAYVAVSCYDSPSPKGAAAWDALAAELAAIAPRFGAAVANEIRPCAHWDLDTGPAPAPVVAAGAAPILVMTTTGDPATPAANAQAVAAQLQSATLLTVESGDHTTFQTGACARRAVARYFLEDILPADGEAC